MSKVSSSSAYYLVDRGANGGVSDNGVRVIAAHPDRRVDMRGNNNHETSATPLMHAGGVASTIDGQVIVVMHTHSFHVKNKKSMHHHKWSFTKQCR